MTAGRRIEAADAAMPIAVHERRLTLVGVIARCPGVSFADLHDHLNESTGRNWAKATVYEDIRHLKAAGLLAGHRHRAGYFLDGPATSFEEMRVLFNGLRIQAEDLQHPLAKALYDELARRHARAGENHAYFGYPTEAIANRPVVRCNTPTIAGVMAALREPMLRGQQVRIRRVRDMWRSGKSSDTDVYALQFVYHDAAWYLLCEDAHQGTFFTVRVDRLSPVVVAIPRSSRGAQAQLERLELARTLLARGWDFIMPEHDRTGRLTVPLVRAVVCFEPEAGAFIQEADQRHPTQRVRVLGDRRVELEMQLPDQPSIWLFFRAWVRSWGDAATLLEPRTEAALIATRRPSSRSL